MAETTALGAAIAAGCAEGINCWKEDASKTKDSTGYDVFKPNLAETGMNIV